MPETKRITGSGSWNLSSTRNKVTSGSDILHTVLIFPSLLLTYLPFADAVPKKDFDTLQATYEKLKEKVAAEEEKCKNLVSERTKLAESLEEKTAELDTALSKISELEGKNSTLQEDLDAVTKDSEVLEKQLLSNLF